MARYEDTATPFAEQQFAGVIERKQKEAEKQDKFAKRLLAFKTVAEGANAIIDQRAEQLEANQSAKKAAYTKIVQNAEDLLKQEQVIVESGRTTKDYLAQQYYTQLVTDAESTYKNYNLGATANSKGFTPYNFLRTKANEMATTQGQLFDKAIAEAKDVGTLADLETRWSSLQNIQAPKTIFGNALSAAKNIFGKETPETVAYKEGIATDALFNQPIVKEYKEFGDSLKIYNKAGFDVGSIINDLGSNFDMVVKQGEPNVTSVSETYIDANGVKKNKTKLVAFSKDANEKINIIKETVMDAIVPPDAIETTSIEKALESVPDQFKDEASEYFSGSYSTQEDLMSFYKWQASDKAFRKSPIKDVKDGIDLVNSVQAGILSSLGYLSQEQIDKYGLTGYEVGEKMYSVDLNNNNLITPRPEFGEIIKDKGWDFVSLVDSYFENFDITGLEMYGSDGQPRTISNATVYREEVINQNRRILEKRDLIEKQNYSTITSDISKEILSDIGGNPIANLVQTASRNNQTGLITLDDITDLSKLGISGVSGTGTIAVDLDDNLIYYKAVDSDDVDNFTASNTTVNKTDSFTINYQDKKLLNFDKVNTLMEDLDLSNLSTDQLIFLANTNLYDIKSRIGLEDISRGGIFKSGADEVFVEKLYEKKS